jgi:hypothetical protein
MSSRAGRRCAGRFLLPQCSALPATGRKGAPTAGLSASAPAAGRTTRLSALGAMQVPGRRDASEIAHAERRACQTRKARPVYREPAGPIGCVERACARPAQTASNSDARPWPPPMHMVTMP